MRNSRYHHYFWGVFKQKNVPVTAAAAREVARGPGAAMGSEVVDSEAEVDWEMADWGAAAGSAAAAANESDRQSAQRLERAFTSLLLECKLESSKACMDSASLLFPSPDVCRAAHELDTHSWHRIELNRGTQLHPLQGQTSTNVELQVGWASAQQ